MPGIVYDDLLIIGSRVSENAEAAPGYIRAFDIRTGQLKWNFNTIPQPGEFGYETWTEGAWQTAGDANSWAGMSLDEKRGVVYIPTVSAAFDFWGGNRKGENLFANCILALDAKTGNRIWHYQTVHHDLWDRDLPAPPNLLTVTHKGKKVDAVAQITKSGFVFLLDRETGEPLFPVEERPVPASDLSGEEAWPTQPFPLSPPPFVPQVFTVGEVTNISKESHDYVSGILPNVRTGKPFIPPSTQGTVIFPGFDGGGEWGGAAEKEMLAAFLLNPGDFAPNNEADTMQAGDAHLAGIESNRDKVPYSHTGYNRFLDKEGYPAVKPPWGTISAIDLNEGTILWQVPLGEFEELSRRGIPKTGTENYGGPVITAGGLLFIGASKDGYFRVFDKDTGEELWKHQLSAGGYATSSVYEA